MQQPLSTHTPDERELDRLVRRVRDGSAGAFDELVGRVRERLLRWAHRLTGDADDAEDVAQVVLLRLHSHVRQFEGRSRITSWLYRVTHNVAVDRRRIEARRAQLLELEQAREEAAGETAEAVASADAERLGRLVRAYFAELPARQRQVFELVDLRGVAAVDAAARMGITPSTARVLLLNARRAIRLRMLSEHPTLLEEYRQ